MPSGVATSQMAVHVVNFPPDLSRVTLDIISSIGRFFCAWGYFQRDLVVAWVELAHSRKLIGGPMEKREQVFVSSTYQDLQEERKEVILGLLQADCFPAGMELFPASNQEKWDLIKGVIDDSDYYLLIIGGKYGSIDPDTKLSYTEMEFDYAVTTGKPVMAFLHGNPGQLTGDQLDIDAGKQKKLASFRAKAEKNMVKYWTSSAELPGHIAHALMQLRKQHKPVGWVRGNHAMTPETRAEIAELRASLAEVRQRESAADQPLFDDLADGEDVLLFGASVSFNAVDGKSYSAVGQWEVAWNKIFSELGPLLLHETNQYELEQRLKAFLMAYALDEGVDQEDDEPTKVVSFYRFELPMSSLLDDILVQLLALRLIERGTQRRRVNDDQRYWKLSDKGEDRLMAMRAIRRTQQG